MALIGTIRKNGWILIVMMILALGGFILMEYISNAQRNSAGDVNTMGKVNGNIIKRDEFEKYQQLIYSNPSANPYTVRTQVWDYFVERALIQEEAEEIGLGVGEEELDDLQYGNNLSPLIIQRYGENGQVDRNYLSQIKTALETNQIQDPRFPQAWAEQSKEITKQALEDKLTDMVSKGIFTPTWMAEMTFRENNERIDLAYVRVPYDKVPDSEIQITDSDYKKYLAENPRLHDQQEEKRVISYAVFDVKPSSADSASARQAIDKLLEGLRTAENDSAFVTLNDGTYDAAYKRKSALPSVVADTLLRLPAGSIVGPYLDGGNWSIAKIIDRKSVPDSVRARHILFQGATKVSENKIDSLMALIKGGKARFDSLAIQNSQDPGSGSKGGDLGWFAEGAMVPEFNDVCFYKGEQGKLYKVATQFGWHLIEITGKKFIKNDVGVKAVYLSQRIEPGKTTQQAVKDRAIALSQAAKNLEDFNKQVLQNNLQVQNSTPVSAVDFSIGSLGIGEGSRDMVRWAFEGDREAGEVAKEVFVFRDASGGYFDSKYVVAALKSVMPAGKATVESIKGVAEVETKIKNDKRFEVIQAKLKDATTLEQAAQQYGITIDTARQTSMLQAGGEPRLIGTAFSLEKGAVSKPIPGSGGVYVIQLVSDRPQISMPADLTLFRRQVASSTNAFIRRELMNSIRKSAEIKDNRSKFF